MDNPFRPTREDRLLVEDMRAISQRLSDLSKVFARREATARHRAEIRRYQEAARSFISLPSIEDAAKPKGLEVAIRIRGVDDQRLIAHYEETNRGRCLLCRECNVYLERSERVWKGRHHVGCATALASTTAP